jgi:Mg/Co/Ni transporter MgtE
VHASKPSAPDAFPLLRRRDFASLKRSLAQASGSALARDWPTLAPMDKLAVFKLLDEARGLDLFARLPFEEQYFLLGGFETGSIAPLLSGLSADERALFRDFPRSLYGRMIELMKKKSPVPTIP